MITLQQAIENMITYHIGRNDDPEGLASELAIYIKHYGDDLEELVDEMNTDLADCIAMDEEDE